MLGRESNNDVAMNGCGRVGDRNEAAIWCTPKRVEDALNVSRRVFHWAGHNLERQRNRCCPCCDDLHPVCTISDRVTIGLAKLSSGLVDLVHRYAIRLFTEADPM